MCVIMLMEDQRPTKEMVEKAWDWNDNGGGIAYRENGEVVWKKGIMDYDEMEALVMSVPLPAVAHFRIASSGGVKAKLCHPFPIEKRASLALTGHTKGYVLFHNGDWKDWSDVALKTAITKGIPIPTGQWNDTRAMAWLCAIYGNGFMEFLPTQRGIAFGPEDLDVFTGPGWFHLNGVWCSNDIFMTKGFTRNQWGDVCEFGNCMRRDGIDTDHRCPGHRKPHIAQTVTPEVSQPQVTPFPQGAPPADQRPPVIGLALAERWRKDKRISKGLIKDIRRAHQQMKDPAQGAKAFKWLVELTSKALSSGRRA